MLAGNGNRFLWRYTNAGAPSTTPGTSVPSHATVANLEGNWTEIASSANIAEEVWLLVIQVSSISASGNIRNALIDIGIDPAGGSSYSVFIENLLCSQAGSFVNGGFWFYFPIRIPAGASVAARYQSNSTAITARVSAWFYGKPTAPELVWRGCVCETIGTISSSTGVAFTPGNSGAEGSRVSLGTTTRALKWFQLSAGIANNTTTAVAYLLDLDWSNDATNFFPILEDVPMFLPGTAEITGLHAGPNILNAFCDVPAGATLYIRGSCSGTAVTGFSALAHGVG